MFVEPLIFRAMNNIRCRKSVPSFAILAAAFGLVALGAPYARAADAIIVDHTCAKLSAIPASAIKAAKSTLNIAYGHTSHGSQLTTGMTGLASWKGDLYAWNGTGDGDALELHDYYGSFGGSGADDLGSPDRTTWATATETYLKANTDVNVVIWSWCGEVDGTEAEIAQYLSLMSGLETEFPNVKFVYMTGHLNGTGEDGNVNVRNEQIRTYCKNNGKILYDFADIESYDPDGETNYMKLDAYDSCEYDPDSVGRSTANWAQDWQNSHTENVDWYDCDSAHSEPLNANQKAYAAWYLWARLAGWDGESTLGWSDYEETDGEGWYKSWYGWFYNGGDFGDWIYSAVHGYQYIWSGSATDSVYLWDSASGAWWWTCGGFYPTFYDYGCARWYCYVQGTGAARTFWDYTAGASVGISSL
jgi:hypothetical protein